MGVPFIDIKRFETGFLEEWEAKVKLLSKNAIFWEINASCAKVDTKILKNNRSCAKINTREKYFFLVREN